MGHLRGVLLRGRGTHRGRCGVHARGRAFASGLSNSMAWDPSPNTLVSWFCSCKASTSCYLYYYIIIMIYIYYIYTHNICIQYTHKIINIYMLVPNQFQQIYTNYCTLLYMQIWMCSKLTDVGSLSCVANLYKQRHDNKSVLESNPSQTNSWLFWFSNHTSDRTWNETHVENQPLQLVAGLSCPTLAPISQTICTLWLFNIAMV